MWEILVIVGGIFLFTFIIIKAKKEIEKKGISQ